MKKCFNRDYWDSIVSKSRGNGPEDLWRAHMKDLYQKLKNRWAGNAGPRCILKTDLYDEAISTHNLIPLFGSKCERIIGTDVSFEIASAAKRRMADEWRGWNNIAVSDARSQAFKSNVFDEIISNSTLDHFSDKKDIIDSLKELYRILRPGGTLIITLDNPWNPVVFLRNALPYRLLKLFGIIPYYMGITLSESELIRTLESNGFKVSASTFIDHTPRILAVWTSRFLNKISSRGISACFEKLLKMFERLERLPTRCLTGNYVAVKAMRR